jgi:hypothetical protein
MNSKQGTAGTANVIIIYLTANWLLPGASCTTKRHNIQITYITQNDTPLTYLWS